MHKNYDCFKFNDVTLTWMLGHAFIFAPNYYQTSSIFILEGHFNQEKNIIEQLASAATLLLRFVLAQENNCWIFGTASTIFLKSQMTQNYQLNSKLK